MVSLVNSFVVTSRTPSKQVVPHEVLFLGEHSHDDECVQVDALTQHPEVVTAKQVQVNKHDHLTAHLVGGGVA